MRAWIRGNGAKRGAMVVFLQQDDILSYIFAVHISEAVADSLSQSL